MGLLKHFRSRTKLTAEGNQNDSFNYPVQPAIPGQDYITALPPKVLKIIFEFVCPHTLEKSYEAGEKADVGDGCMLCDLRDLAHCAAVSRSWYRAAQELLYTSIRIDAVHYCELEEILSSNRHRRSRHDNQDVPAVRLHLLANTLRQNNWLGSLVQFLKLPYMTRETCKPDLARAVAGCPNLRYVDLPDGFFTGDLSCNLLRQELIMHCSDLRSMKYHAGSEQFFQQLAQRQWQSIEELELQELRIEPATLRIVIASLPVLHELSITSLPSFTDEIFTDSPQLPPFPPLQTLKISKCRNITAAGIYHYLQAPQNREILTNLLLKDTSVKVPDLAALLGSAIHLTTLTYVQTVSSALPLDPLPPLHSRTLQTLHYEITPSESLGTFTATLPKPTDSYYTYLTHSLLSHSLPSLHTLSVRDPDLPQTLLLAPPQPSFAPSSPSSARTPALFTPSQPLQIFTKAACDDDGEWVFHVVEPCAGSGRPGSSSSTSSGRPLSLVGAARGLGPQWGGEARRSVVVGNGFGGFLAVPEDVVRPPDAHLDVPGSPGGFWARRGSAGKADRRSRADLWR